MSDVVNKPERLMPDQTKRLFLNAVKEPPVTHAYHHWDEENRNLIYTYNGRRIISIHMPGEAAGHFRHGSDGTIQSFPFHQQIYVMLQGQCQATVTFELSADALNMRPVRAGAGEAIVGQVGRPLLPGINGLYDRDQDLMIGWHGRPWNWLNAELMLNEAGNLVAKMEVSLDTQTWCISLKPQFYRTHLGYRYHKPWVRKPNLKPVAGWCTWEAYRREVTEKDVEAGAEFFADKLKAYGLEYVQIDDGFQNLPVPAYPDKPIAEGWLKTKPEFPSGHDGMVKKINDFGFEGGVWMTACTYNDAFSEAQPEVFVKDENGEVMIGDWVRSVLDCEPETLKKHIKPIFEGFKKAGYSYFKIDGIRHLILDGLHEAVMRGLMTNDDAERRFRAYMEASREAMGDDAYLLSSWGVLTQGVGVVDAMRIAQDANPTWAGMQMQLVESARWWFTHRVLYTNDPDHVCVRGGFEWSRTVLSLVSLSGGLFMLSDPINEYDDDRIRLCQQCLPPLATVTAETGKLEDDYPAFAWTKLHGFAVVKDKKDMARPFGKEVEDDKEAYDMVGEWKTGKEDHPFSSLWAFHLNTEVGRWCVAGRFASLPLPASELTIESLNLDPAVEYVAFDFWKQEYLGRVTGKLSVPALPLGHCQVIAIRPRLTQPQLLSSSRHVSQDAVSVKSQAWDGQTLTLKLTGVAGTKETYWIHVPYNVVFTGVSSSTLGVGAKSPMTDATGDVALPIEVEFPTNGAECVGGELAITFEEAQ